ncbi:MAG: hypothetical protein RL318_3150 [Fibrobacterota bacterium]
MQGDQAFFTLAIREAVREQISPKDLYERIDTWARERNAPSEVLMTIRASRTNPPSSYYHQQGWVLIAFGNGLWQLLHAPDLEHAVIDTVRRAATPIPMAQLPEPCLPLSMDARRSHQDGSRRPCPAVPTSVWKA